MKKTITLLAVGIITFGANAQNIVSTDNTNRVAIIEEFTGTSCPACPGGHTTMAGILTANPTMVFGIGYSPTNSSLTGPYSGGLDLTNPFSDVFYTNPYYGNGDGRAMPTAHINRTKYGGSRKSSTGDWASRSAGVNVLASPVNVGIESIYDAGTDMIDVTVEMYFTSGITDAAYVTVILTESDILTTQSGATGNYTHTHVMRASLQNGQWGEALTGTTNQGDLVTMTFSFDNSSTNYVIDNSDIVAFVSTGMDDNSEIITGFQVEANGGNGGNVGIDAIEPLSQFSIYPNPASEEINVLLGNNVNNAEITITNITGQVVYTNAVNGAEGSFVTLSNSDLNLYAGTYFITLTNEGSLSTQKLIIQ
ncbi:MAG: Omp28-related outer membrane protein [Crocinitomicaceae bacterium]|nr:Omp28-related outer membrane protein [Crocinitomicaceae bacterium]